MRRTQLILIALILGTGLLPAQDYDRTLEFHFDDRAIVVPKFGPKVEALPIVEFLGAEAKYSPAAGTYGVLYGEHVIQFAIDHKVLLVDGELQEARETPVASPGGVAVSLSYLERWLLSPLGFHLEPIPRGYRIARGARFAEAVVVRPVAADFGATTNEFRWASEKLRRIYNIAQSPMLGDGVPQAQVDQDKQQAGHKQ